MRNHIYWMDETRSTLIIKVPAYWNWAEMYNWLSYVNQLLDKQALPTTIIVDFQQSSFVPQDSIMNMHKVLRNLPPNIKSIIMTGLNISHQSLLATLFRVYPQLTKPIIIMDNPYTPAKTG